MEKVICDIEDKTSTFKLVERINFKELERLVSLGENLEYNGVKILDAQLTKLNNYYKFVLENRISENEYYCEYYYKFGVYGRLYVKNHIGLQSMWQPLRHTITKDIYEDIDMVNAHPVILETYCKSNNIKCPGLTKYIEKREELLSDLMYRLELDRDICKRIMIRLMYQGSIIGVYLDHKINMSYVPEWLKSFEKEMKRISKEIYLLNKESDIMKSFKKNFDCDLESVLQNIFQSSDLETDLETKSYLDSEINSHSKYNYLEKVNTDSVDDDSKDKIDTVKKIKINPYGGFLSNLINTIENMILLKIKEKLEDLDYSIGSLIFDGLMIYRKEEEISQEVLDKISFEIGEETSYYIPLKVKKMSKFIK
jgi:hypothetical protein